MTALRAAVNQRVALGWESTPGTAATLAKEIAAFDYTLGSKTTTKQFTQTGHRYAAASEELTEEGSFKVKGAGCFNAMGYVLGNIYGKATPVAHSPSTTAYDSIWTPSITGVMAPSPWTIGQGDANYGEQYTYALGTGWGYEVSRKAEVSLTMEGFTQSKTDAVPVFSGVTEVVTVPMVGRQFNLYVDTTSAGLGTTLIVNAIKFGPTVSGMYSEFWPVNRTYASFAAHVDAPPKVEFKLLLPADTQGKAQLANLQSGARVYARVQATGPVLDAPNSVNYGFTHDLCLFVTNVAEFSVDGDVFAVEYTFALAEDTAWNSGQAQKITLTNGLSTY